MVRGGNANNINYRASDRSPKLARCIGDKCAMWRWADAEPPCGPMREEPARPAVVPADAQWHSYDEQSGHGGYWMWTLYGTVRTFSPHMVQSRDRAGYCGLAGRSEVMP